LGLGLAIVRHLVEMHGGTVSVESAGIDQGTTFTVTLPVKASFDDGLPGAENPSLTNETGGFDAFPDLKDKRILIVDDDADARFLLTTIVEKSGALAATAGSAVEALETLKNFQPDILISDIGMPEEDGYTLIKKARALFPDLEKIPAVALTAYAREEDKTLALEAGFQLHVAKPVNPEQLLATLKELSEAEQR
jgi:CheY-like chemotaxis protein